MYAILLAAALTSTPDPAWAAPVIEVAMAGECANGQCRAPVARVRQAVRAVAHAPRRAAFKPLRRVLFGRLAARSLGGCLLGRCR